MSVIYKIYCLDENIKECYIGSTGNFAFRKGQHKRVCNNSSDNNKSYNLKVYTFIRANGGFTNWEFEVLETFNTIDKQDLKKIERKYIETNNSTLNCIIPTRTDQEYKIENKQKIQEYHKKWVMDNREKINERRRSNRAKNRGKIKCECGCMTTKPHISRHRKTKKHIELMQS